MTTTDTEVVAAETERERESAYVSRKRMWRTPPVPSSMMLASASACANVMDRPGLPVPPVAMAVFVGEGEEIRYGGGCGCRCCQ